MAAVGLLCAVVPLAATSGTAYAAQTNATADGSLTFARYGDGAAVTCTASVGVNHNTDDPNHPYVQIFEGFGYLTAFQQECYTNTQITLTVTYKDADGRTQTTVSTAPPSTLKVGGAKSNVTVQMNTYYFDCNASGSAVCSRTITASPK